MTAAHLNVGKLGGDRYQIAFETDAGKVVCEVSVRANDRGESRTADEKRQDALHKAKLLARAFHEAIVVG
jgi:hypothetical protein